MTDVAAFREQLISAQPVLTEWGNLVVEQLSQLARHCGVTPQLITSRVKEVESAVGKLTRKSYADPIRDMTDLVGVRVVCLLSPDVSCLEAAVLNHQTWDSVIARNTAEEVHEQPEIFGYQSLHFELRAKTDMQFNDVLVPAGTCCELQVRTLMQHAYAEVVHDNIYKSTWGASSKARRFVSNSAALIEAADHLFCETMNILENESKARGELLEQLTGLYDQCILPSSGKDQKFNLAVLDEFTCYQPGEVVGSVNELLARKKTIPGKIRDRIAVDPFWAQPVALFAYFLVSKDPEIVRESWPFAESNEALELVFSDLGESFHPY